MKFEAGQTYATRSICDADMVISIKVVSRTAKRLKTEDGKTLGIYEYEGIEQVRPWGRYSMCPIIGADDLVKAKQPTQAPAVKAPVTLNSLMAEGEKLFTPDQFSDLKNMLGGLLGVAIQTKPEPKPTAQIINFADYKKRG
jgi:hypothetical protein